MINQPVDRSITEPEEQSDYRFVDRKQIRKEFRAPTNWQASIAVIMYVKRLEAEILKLRDGK